MTDFIEINGFQHLRYHPQQYTLSEMKSRSASFKEEMKERKSIRHFSEEKIPFEIISHLIETAASAPSGANKQPWTFVVVENPAIKKEIRKAAEAEEKLSYEGRMSEAWIQDLLPLGTDAHKPFLEEAPYLIVVFKRVFEYDETGNKKNNYYVNESVGIACGFLISAIHHAGLVTLTHTPSPMNFLQKILKRPDNERAFLLLPVGLPADKVYVPNIQKKPLEEVMVVQ